MESSSRSARLALSTVLLLGCALRTAQAQDTLSVLPPPQSAVISGVVEMPGDGKQVPVPGVMVTIHRVASDSAGPLDSVKTDSQGRYSVRYMRFGREEAVYFAAAMYRGIAYFSAPIRGQRTSGDDAIISVFDTTSRPYTFLTQGHHVVISAARPDGQRDVVEVWELSNDTSVTVIGRDTLSPVWTTPLDHEALQFAAGQGDVGSGALGRRGDRVALIAPFGPGIKQISYTYSLPSSAFPLEIPIGSRTNVLEVLVEDQAAEVTGARLKATTSAVTQGRTFKRYLAQDIPAGEKLRIVEPTTSAAARARVLLWISVTLATLMAIALAFALSRRKAAKAIVVSRQSPVEALIAEIARLDSDRELGVVNADESEGHRAALKARLASMLALPNSP